MGVLGFLLSPLRPNCSPSSDGLLEAYLLHVERLQISLPCSKMALRGGTTSVVSREECSTNYNRDVRVQLPVR